ncbi:MAG: SPFH domain-containing protein [Rhodanobacteraceae bacterium]|nr:SPFH domain-containing protein [Rhodanobacteraceae bacterium]
MTKEIRKSTLPGIPMLLGLIVLMIVTVVLMIRAIDAQQVLLALLLALGGFIQLFMLVGLFMVQPNNAVVLQLFGRYVGTTRDEGLRWANPFLSKRAVSLRVRNFESNKLKVNELDGSPIEIASVVVWQVVDSAEALFLVDDYENFVHVQSESALRQMATTYPYDLHGDIKIALRSHSKEISQHLQEEIQERLSQAGVKVIEARISHLAYAAEIASVMLRRQQANAVIAARTLIVEGAVSMVELALDQLSKRGVVHLDEERKAAMVSNLLVVLCSDNDAQPVVNAGSLYG